MGSSTKIASRKLASVNPATGEVLREFEAVSEEEVRAAVARACSVQPGWNEIGLRQRLATLRAFQRLLLAKKSEIAQTITREAGKPLVESLVSEVLVVLDSARFCIENAHSFLRPESVPHGNPAMKAKSGHILREPYGVIGIISPWNYPFAIPATESIAALMTGNAVILKPSELTSLVALQLADLLHAAGVPQNIFQVIVGDSATGAVLVNSAIDKLIFTGSVASGRQIAQIAGKRLLPILLELGGKDPMLVLEDAELEIASSGAVWGAFTNAGQACLSVERCYVHRQVYEPFLDLCARKAKQLKVGNGMESGIDVGPLIHERQLRIVEAQVEDARQRGARILVGGSRLRELGPNFYAPTVLADCTHEMRIMREETFGPVFPVTMFDTDSQAVSMANDSEYGLAASVWTRNRARGEALARQIHAGTVMINDAVSCYGISEAPHGGAKASGIGRTHGRYGMEEMVRIKYIDSDRLPGMKKLWWFGYSEEFRRRMEGFADLMFSRSLIGKLRGALRSAGALRQKGKL
jgi:acyl-CoA reductase-like NAD-dependent aldehyde dehydrogenase